MGPNSDAKVEIVKTISPIDVYNTEKFLTSTFNDKASNLYLQDTYLKKRKNLFSVTKFLNLVNLNFSSNNIEGFKVKNLKKIREAFERELKQNNVSDNLLNIELVFSSLESNISELKFTEVAVEIIDCEAIKFTLLFESNRTLMITKSTEIVNEFNDDNVIFFTLFVENRRIVSDFSDLSKFIDGFKKYLVI